MKKDLVDIKIPTVILKDGPKVARFKYAKSSDERGLFLDRKNSIAIFSSRHTSAVGPKGASAYEIWLAEGNIGTEEDFLNSLKGPSGEEGLSWIKLVTSFSVNPEKIANNGLGDIYQYSYSNSLVLYRLISETEDAFYQFFDGTNLSNLIVKKRVSVEIP